MTRLGTGTLIGIVLLSCAVAPTANAGEITTIRGVAQQTKDGLYVQGVLILEELLPRGESVERLVGKTVEVKGTLETNRDDPLPSGPPGPVVQQRTGPYQYMTKILSIQIRGSSSR